MIEQSSLQLYGIYYLQKDFLKKEYPQNYPNEHDNTKRPFLLVGMEANGVLWMVPLSRRVEKYRNELIKHPNACIFYKFPNETVTVILIQNAFPCRREHISDTYKIQQIPFIIKKKETKQAINKKFNCILSLINRDLLFDSNKIKNMYFNYSCILEDKIKNAEKQQHKKEIELNKNVHLQKEDFFTK